VQISECVKVGNFQSQVMQPDVPVPIEADMFGVGLPQRQPRRAVGYEDGWICGVLAHDLPTEAVDEEATGPVKIAHGETDVVDTEGGGNRVSHKPYS